MPISWSRTIRSLAATAFTGVVVVFVLRWPPPVNDPWKAKTTRVAAGQDPIDPEAFLSDLRQLLSNEPEVFRLIEALAAVNEPGPGYHPKVSGSGFVLFPGVGGVSSIRFGAPKGQVPEPFRRLVELGPRAIPGLILALEDRRETLLEVVHEGTFGALRFGREVHYEPEEGAKLDLAVQLGVSQRYRHTDLTRPTAQRYRVTVADLCYAILGQIVNRSYESVRHQPTNCVVVNSPLKSPAIAAFVQEVWAGNPEIVLLRSLESDLVSSDREIRAGAAVRLWSYYPHSAVAMISGRIQAEDGAVIQAAQHLTNPSMSNALDAVADSTTDPHVFAVASREARILADPQSWFRRARIVVEGADPSVVQNHWGVHGITRVALRVLGSDASGWFEWVAQQQEDIWRQFTIRAVRTAISRPDLYVRKRDLPEAREWLGEMEELLIR